MAPDHYEVLGLSQQASHAAIAAAYRRLMREHHPDLRPDDPAAGETARRVTAAWAVLGRPSTRAAYDRTRAQVRGPLPSPRPTADQVAAYSPAGRDYRRSFHLASVKVAAVVVLLGAVVLAATGR